jgi:hypothetical protein
MQLRAIFNHDALLLVIHHTPLSIDFVAMQGCNGSWHKPALSHERSHTTGTTNRVVHIPHNYRHADLLHCVSGTTMREGRLYRIDSATRSV